METSDPAPRHDAATSDERPWALVTGASGGMGTAFCRYLAARGVNLAVTSRRADVLESLADELRVGHGVKVEVIACDIADRQARHDLVAELTDRGIGPETLINNAGFGSLGTVTELGPDDQLAQVDVNCQAVVHLCSLIVPTMVQAHRGSVINVASTAAFQPLPGFATYAATKAFVLSFTQALWQETRNTGVRVTAICPGPTRTGFFDVAGGLQPTASRHPDQVVRTAFDALARNRPYAVDGATNLVGAAIGRHAPSWLELPLVDRGLPRLFPRAD
ncbi:SDR family NAD(P)-dependent oxidoreductase [Acidipropionibacterium timonense]|uniref:SDR family NAD(P)-dependent oxidoreductase n=1 Tax=Acidipropionibacterium timonense TaxID=2161818 RepID=UPI0010320A44